MPFKCSPCAQNTNARPKTHRNEDDDDRFARAIDRYRTFAWHPARNLTSGKDMAYREAEKKQSRGENAGVFNDGLVKSLEWHVNKCACTRGRGDAKLSPTRTGIKIVSDGCVCV